MSLFEFFSYQDVEALLWVMDIQVIAKMNSILLESTINKFQKIFANTKPICHHNEGILSMSDCKR